MSEMKVKKQIIPGTVIHTEKPFVYCLSSKLRTQKCDFCFKGNKLMKCTACKYVYYCGKYCQKEGWNIHKHECKNIVKVSPRIIPDAARTLARLIRILQKGGDLVKSYYQKNNYRMFKDLMSHYSELKNDQTRIEHVSSLYEVLTEYLDINVPNYAEFMGMYGRMCINSFNIMDPEMQVLGTGMYLGASVIDHSCQPNAVVVFEGTTLNVRSLETFQYLDWSQIFIAYIDILNTTKDRQNELMITYYFLCQCSKCMSPEFPEINAAACPNSNCDNYITIDECCNSCEKCEVEITQEFKQKFEEIIEFTEIHLKNMDELAYYDVCKICLEKHKGVLHKFNVKHVKTLDLAFQASIDFEKWDSAEEFGFELISCYYKYYGKITPLTGLLHLKLGKLLLYQEKLQEAFIHLKAAYEILRITHGCTSSVFKEHLMPLLEQAQIR